jgi:hypothetical protein
MASEAELRFWIQVGGSGKPADCWPFKGYRNKEGYGRVSIAGKLMLAHRVAWILTNGPIPKSKASKHGTVVMHRCDNPACCNPKHLRLGTQRENIADRKTKGRDGNHKGTAHGKAKFTDAQILMIRASEESGAELARQFGVSRTCIWQIRHRKNWSHV